MVIECRQPNYLAKDGKIWAVDPENTTAQTEITIRGVSWSGMEKINMIPDGLYGSTVKNSYGTQGTKVVRGLFILWRPGLPGLLRVVVIKWLTSTCPWQKTLMTFLSNNSFNSVRLPLNAEYVYVEPKPQIAYIHDYDNPELTTWDDIKNVKYIDLLARVIETLQDQKITVLLDIHLLTKYDQDAYWYTAPYVNITQSGAYRAITYLAERLCTKDYWNVIGIDLKNEMLNAEWNENEADSNVQYDWHQAAQVLANSMVNVCPQWLAFVGGASSPSSAQDFFVSDDYTKASEHWDGGNMHNATVNPVNISVANKIVYAPHAHAHGVLPQNYFFTPESKCSSDQDDIDGYKLSGAATETECWDFVNGTKTKSEIGCTTSAVMCKKYEHLSADEIVANYKKVMEEALGSLPTNGDIPLVLGSFSGVYGAKTQPHQTAALDYLIDFAASVQGGYFWALNPDSEFYLEDSTDGKTGAFSRGHYGVFQTQSWQQPYEDLLKALARIPSSEIPCYGSPNNGDDDSAAGIVSLSAAAAVASVAASLLLLAM